MTKSEYDLMTLDEIINLLLDKAEAYDIIDVLEIDAEELASAFRSKIKSSRTKIYKYLEGDY